MERDALKSGVCTTNQTQQKHQCPHDRCRCSNGPDSVTEVEQAKYLGITLSDKLDWEAQVDNITKKASNTLNFLKRNLKYCPKQCKEVAYFALVRSTVEYGSVVWDPHTIKEKDQVERVNRRAARMVSIWSPQQCHLHAHPTWLGYS